MVFTFKNLGPIKEATLEVGDLTLLCGQNNTGKTYLTYGVYSFLYNFHFLVYKQVAESVNVIQINQQINQKGYVAFKAKDISDFLDLKKISQFYLKQLAVIFNSDEGYFSKTEVSVEAANTPFVENRFDYTAHQNGQLLPHMLSIHFDKDSEILSIKGKMVHMLKDTDLLTLIVGSIADFIINSLFKPFVLTPERSNIRLFINELDSTRNEIMNKLMHTNPQKMNSIFNNQVAQYALPIQENLDFVRNLSTITKHNSFLQKDYPKIITYIENMLGIEYVVKEEQLWIVDKTTQYTFPYYMASTSIRTLADLHLWLKHTARPDNILFVDEPELNIHPENQIKLARLFAKLVNIGIKVFITTHSEYIVKEFNNLITLSNNFKGKADFMKRYGYTKQDMLLPTKIKSYIAEKGTLTAVPVDEFGLLYTTFDDSIQQINKVAGEMAFFIEESETVEE